MAVIFIPMAINLSTMVAIYTTMEAKIRTGIVVQGTLGDWAS